MAEKDLLTRMEEIHKEHLKNRGIEEVPVKEEYQLFVDNLHDPIPHRGHTLEEIANATGKTKKETLKALKDLESTGDIQSINIGMLYKLTANRVFAEPGIKRRREQEQYSKEEKRRLELQKEFEKSRDFKKESLKYDECPYCGGTIHQTSRPTPVICNGPLSGGGGDYEMTCFKCGHKKYIGGIRF